MRLPRPRRGARHDEFVTPRCFGLRAEPLHRAGPRFRSGMAFVLAVAAEYRRATAAARRYEELKRMARAPDDPAANAARRIYMEFYFDG
jgi:hypothetical protein